MLTSLFKQRKATEKALQKLEKIIGEIGVSNHPIPGELFQ